MVLTTQTVVTDRNVIKLGNLTTRSKVRQPTRLELKHHKLDGVKTLKN